MEELVGYLAQGLTEELFVYPCNSGIFVGLPVLKGAILLIEGLSP